MVKKLSHTLLAQAVGFLIGAIAGTLISATEWFPLVVIVGHCGGAVIVAAFLGLSRPWIYLNALLPLGILLTTLLPVSVTLLTLLLLFVILLYIPTLISGVPYYPTSIPVYEHVLSLIPKDKSIRFLDLGSGFGALLNFLSKNRTDSFFFGVELSPLAWFVSKIRFMFTKNCRVEFKDIWQTNLGEYDFVYSFLAPGPMKRLWTKAKKEMRPGSIFVTNTFQVPDAAPHQTISLADSKQSALYVFKL